ncbi:MAG: ABC transporter ATP-binding protein, partial [Spirochaetota bacterium]
LKAQKLPQAEVDARVNQVLALIGLENMKDKHPFRLSMGQKRRLSVATMIILKTDILILDEPTRGQDRKNIDNIVEILMDTNRQGTTIILVTHDMNLVARYCNKILVMDKGELVFFGSKKDFFLNFSSIRSNILVLPEIYALVQLLTADGIDRLPEIYTVDELVDTLEAH